MIYTINNLQTDSGIPSWVLYIAIVGAILSVMWLAISIHSRISAQLAFSAIVSITCLIMLVILAVAQGPAKNERSNIADNQVTYQSQHANANTTLHCDFQEIQNNISSATNISAMEFVDFDSACQRFTDGLLVPFTGVSRDTNSKISGNAYFDDRGFHVLIGSKSAQVEE